MSNSYGCPTLCPPDHCPKEAAPSIGVAVLSAKETTLNAPWWEQRKALRAAAAPHGAALIGWLAEQGVHCPTVASAVDFIAECFSDDSGVTVEVFEVGV